MKLVVRKYLRSLKERGELDVLLPQILSELGYEVIHHPMRGTKQAGVDVAAVGPDPDANEEIALHLFVIKPGDLNRGDWDGTPQAVRSSLNEVRDDYLPNRVTDQFSNLPVSICLCIGGEIKEAVRSAWRGFVEQNKTEIIRYREWNGDRLSNLILSGVLSKEFLNVDYQDAFQKAVTMVSEPETSYQHFRNLAFSLTNKMEDDCRGTRRLRQLFICLWILVSNGIESENLEAPYKTCELALLFTWDSLNRSFETKNAEKEARVEVFYHILELYLSIGCRLIIDKMGPYSESNYALSLAVRSNSALDGNLALFEAMGRGSLLGLWYYFIGEGPGGTDRDAHLAQSDEFLNFAISLINGNPTLNTPIRDDHHVEIGLLMLLSEKHDAILRVEKYLREIAYRLIYRYRMRSLWPTHFVDYRKLARHPLDRSDNYFRKSTTESVLVPFMQVALQRIGAKDELSSLQSTVGDKLPEMTQQVWVPNDKTNKFIWRQGTSQGIGIPVSTTALNDQEKTSLANRVNNIAQKFNAISKMPDMIPGLLIPMFLLACRHHRLPLPPHLWFK